jgi:hypothetical protein
MLQAPVLSPDFSLEDIKKLRAYDAEMMKNMTKEERRAYIEEDAAKMRKILAEMKAVESSA